MDAMLQLNRRFYLPVISCLLIGLHSATAQDLFDGAGQDVPEWLEEFGYEDGYEERTSRGYVAGQASSDGYSTCDAPGCDSMTGCDGGRCACADKGICARAQFTGDWCGVRSRLQQSGITYKGRLVQFGMGIAGGFDAPVPAPLGQGDVFKYTGTARHDFIIDLNKFGGPKHGKLVCSLGQLWGDFDSVANRGGGLVPVFNAFMPTDPDANAVPRLTQFMYLQPVSENLILGAGKLQLPGTADSNDLAGGDGTDQFFNQWMASNPLFLAVFPIQTFAFTAISPQEWGSVSLSVVDPQERSLQYFEVGDLFAEGMVLTGEVKVNTNFHCKPGQQHVGFAWKHSDLPDLSATPAIPIYPYPPAPPTIPSLDDSWLLYYGFDQYLNVFGRGKEGDPLGWGLFGRAGIADGGSGNPNFFGWSAEIGIGGDSPWGRHRGDQFGIGYAYVGTTTEWGPLSEALLGPRDSQLLEAYYKFQVTPSIAISPDVQWARGLVGGGLFSGDDAFIYGLRTYIEL